MKLIGLLICILFLICGCVQKTYDKTVVYYLHTGQLKDVKTAGIRGSDTPLKWNADSSMVLQNDSTYKVIITYKTGFKFTEAKFVINDKVELKGEDNRRILFSTNDTTVYQAKFDNPN